MDRRLFLHRVAGAAGLGLLGDRRALAQYNDSGTPAWDFDNVDATTPVPSDFLGLSFEIGRVAEGDYLVSDNESLMALMRGLGPAGIIRVGGNSSDRPPQSPLIGVGRPQLDKLASFLEATGWRLIYGLNLGSGTPEQAAAEAQSVAEAVGSRLLAFQLGNEPDLYGANGLRPGGYGVGPYVQDWNRFSVAVRQRVPDARFGGPDLCCDTSWLARFAHGTEPKPQFLSHHFYSEGPAGNPGVTAVRMLASTPSLIHRLNVIQQAAGSPGLPLRMTEINSVWNGGQPGVSDTFAAAIWAFNALCTIAASGWAGVNFHGNRGACYSPLWCEPDGQFVPAPIYYGLQLFAALRASCFSADPDANASASLQRFTLRTKEGRKRAVLINLSPDQPGLTTLRTRTHEVALHRFERQRKPGFRREVRFEGRPLHGTTLALDGPGKRLKANTGILHLKVAPLSVLVVDAC